VKPKPPPEGDVDLLAQYRAGDSQAFRQLVDRYRDRMLQFFYRLCWDRDRAEDLVQDLFLKLLLGSRRYRPEGRLGTFVYRVATNLWIDHYRQMRPRPRCYSFDQVTLPDGETGPSREFAGDAKTPLQEVTETEEKAAMRRAIDSLTEPHRIVFELAVYQERPYGEISELLGIPVGTVKSRMHNTVQALKQIMGAAGERRDAERRGPRRDIGGAG